LTITTWSNTPIIRTGNDVHIALYTLTITYLIKHTHHQDDGCVWSGTLLPTFTMSCTHHYQFLCWVCLIRYAIVNFYNVMYTSLPVLMMGVFDQVCYCQRVQCDMHIITSSYDGCVWSGCYCQLLQWCVHDIVKVGNRIPDQTHPSSEQVMMCTWHCKSWQ
jgi:hypothetical protein